MLIHSLGTAKLKYRHLATLATRGTTQALFSVSASRGIENSLPSCCPNQKMIKYFGPKRPWITRWWWRDDTQISGKRLVVRFPAVKISFLFDIKFVRWLIVSRVLALVSRPSIYKWKWKYISIYSKFRAVTLETTEVYTMVWVHI